LINLGFLGFIIRSLSPQKEIVATQMKMGFKMKEMMDTMPSLPQTARRSEIGDARAEAACAMAIHGPFS